MSNKREYRIWYNNFPAIADIREYLEDAYPDLQRFRALHEVLWKYRDNGYDDETYDAKKEANLLRAQTTFEAEDIISSGLRFPDFRVDAANVNDKKSEENQTIANAVMNWMIRMTGFETAYNESKQDMIVSGDGYRRPFQIKMANGSWFPQYEDLSPTEMLLDVDATDLWSETRGRASSWVARLVVYSEGQAIMRFGKEVVGLAQPNVAAVDVDVMTAKVGEPESKTGNYYECIELQDISEGLEAVFLGGGMMPVVKHGKLKGLEKKIKKIRDIEGFSWSNTYKHLDEFGNPMLTYHGQAFDSNKFNIRNHGIVQRLMRWQDAEQILLNGGFEASNLRMMQIPTMTGVNSDIAMERIMDWKERREEDPYAFLDVSAQLPGADVKLDVLKFDGVSQDETDKSLHTLRTTMRNYNGFDLNRLEVRSNEGLGQTKILEAEKIQSIEKIAERQVGKFRHELVGLLRYFINHDGFALHDTTITCTLFHEIENPETKEKVEVRNPKATISLPEAAKRLKDFDFNVHIDMDTIVKKGMLSMVDDLIKMLGTVDGAAQPEVKKTLQKMLFSSMGTNTPDSIFDGVENEVPQGGASQFQPGAAQPNQPQE